MESQKHEMPKWLSLAILICVGTMNIGNYYCYDLPQAFQTPFELKYKFTTQQTQFLYTVYSLPNTVITFFGGIMVSKIGDKLSVLVFTMAIWIGSVIFALGIWAESYTCMVIGRVIFGLGGENLITAQMICTAKWFRGKFLSAAIGLNLVFCYFGGMLNNFFTPYMEEKMNSPFKTSVCVMMILSFSTLMAYLYVWLSLKYEHLLDPRVVTPCGSQFFRKNSLSYSAPLPDNTENQNTDSNQNGEILKWSDMKLLPLNFWP
jgi:MFS family permease